MEDYSIAIIDSCLITEEVKYEQFFDYQDYYSEEGEYLLSSQLEDTWMQLWRDLNDKNSIKLHRKIGVTVWEEGADPNIEPDLEYELSIVSGKYFLGNPEDIANFFKIIRKAPSWTQNEEEKRMFNLDIISSDKFNIKNHINNLKEQGIEGFRYIISNPDIGHITDLDNVCKIAAKFLSSELSGYYDNTLVINSEYDGEKATLHKESGNIIFEGAFEGYRKLKGLIDNKRISIIDFNIKVFNDSLKNVFLNNEISFVHANLYMDNNYVCTLRSEGSLTYIIKYSPNISTELFNEFISESKNIESLVVWNKQAEDLCERFSIDLPTVTLH